jgi:hypothetical protein
MKSGYTLEMIGIAGLFNDRNRVNWSSSWGLAEYLVFSQVAFRDFWQVVEKNLPIYPATQIKVWI